MTGLAWGLYGIGCLVMLYSNWRRLELRQRLPGGTTALWAVQILCSYGGMLALAWTYGLGAGFLSFIAFGFVDSLTFRLFARRRVGIEEQDR